MNRALIPLLALVLSVPLAACGGNNSSPPRPPTLDEELQGLMAIHDVAPVVPPAAHDPALVTLGRHLFFDKIISGDRNISCATCHHPASRSGDALPVSIGTGGVGLAENRLLENGQFIPRNAPPIFNAGLPGHDSAFWDSRVARDPVTGELTTPEPGLNGPTPALAVEAALLETAVMAQAMFPPTSPPEMRGQPGKPDNEVAGNKTMQEVWALLIDRLVGTSDDAEPGIAAYRTLFAAAYPGVGADWDAYTFAHAARAIGAYEISAFTKIDTPFDRYIGGDETALSEQEKRGAVLFFGRAACADCHSGPLLSDFEHRAIGAPQVGPGRSQMNGPNESPDDRGLALISGNAADDYKFRTPPLRNVALTGPWMHDGAFNSLEAVIEHYDDPLFSLMNYDADANLPEQFEGMVDTDAAREQARIDAFDSLLLILNLTDEEDADLLAFLHALTDPSAIDLTNEIPDEVPSGLPVTD